MRTPEGNEKGAGGGWRREVEWSLSIGGEAARGKNCNTQTKQKVSEHTRHDELVTNVQKGGVSAKKQIQEEKMFQEVLLTTWNRAAP